MAQALVPERAAAVEEEERRRARRFPAEELAMYVGGDGVGSGFGGQLDQTANAETGAGTPG